MSRFTDTRKKILEIIKSSDKPLRASDIKSIMEDVNISTIYRGLEFLEKNRYIYRLSFSNECTFYSVKEKRHFIFCENCKEIQCIDICPSTSSGMNEIENTYNFKIKEHTLFLKGVCDKCKSSD